MADVARLGVKFDSSDLTVAEQKLKKLPAAAGSAEQATKKLENTLAAMGIKAGTASTGFNALINTTNKAASSNAAFAKNVLNSSTSINALGVGLTSTSGKLNGFTGTFENVTAAVNNAEKNLQRFNVTARSTGNTAGQLQANTTNLVAQFQDIGVTASMGMNPMLIGMQQGSQIALVMQQAIGANGLAGGLAQLGKSFLSVLGPVTALSIAFTAGLAALIQWVDWTALAKSALNGLATVVEAVTPYVLAFGAAMALVYAPALISAAISAFTGLISILSKLALTLISLISLPVLIVGGFLAIVAAAIHFRDELANILGFDIVEMAEKGLNMIVGFFVGGFRAIMKTWRQFPAAYADILITVVNKYIETVEKMINFAIDGLNKLGQMANNFTGMDLFGSIGNVSLGRIENQFAGAGAAVGNVFVDEFGKAVDQKLGTKGIKAAVDLGKRMGAGLRNFAAGLGTKTEDGRSPKSSGGKTEEEKFQDIIDRAQRSIDAMNAEREALTLSAFAAASLKAKTDLVNQAKQAGITLDLERMKIIDDMADKIATAELALADAKQWQTTTKAIDDQLKKQKEEMDMLGMSADAVSRYKWETVWLNDEIAKYNNITPEQIEKLRQSAEAMANNEIATRGMTDELKKQKEQMDFSKSTFKSFFTDMYSDVRQGKSIWSAFGDAVIGVLDRIAERLYQMWVDEAFQSIVMGKGAGGGGFLGSLASGLGAALGGGGTNSYGVQGGNIYAKGGTFGPTMFAKGSAFTNTIVNSPTAFAFGRGGANLGIMGEAGEEAVMPLKRGPDGSLGVQMYGGGSGAARATNVSVSVQAVRGELFDVIVGDIAEQKATETTQAGLTAFNEQLPDRFNQIANDDRAR